MRKRRRRRRNLTYQRLGSNERIRRQRSRRNAGLLAVGIGLAAVLVLVLLVVFFSGAEDAESHNIVSGTPIGGNAQSSTTGSLSQESGMQDGNEQGSGETGEAIEPGQEGTAESGEAEGEGAGSGETDAGSDGTDTLAGEWNYHAEDRPKVKGIYVTGPLAGNERFEELLTLVDETELNAMVIDVKNDGGEITYKMNLESAQSMGACINYIRDMESFMARLKEHGIYTIARIVCFKDPYLAANCPELALKTTDGRPVVDGHDVAWVNPYKEDVWKYLVDVARKAGEVGFDEIQFDYVRFPIGDVADAADYGVDMTTYTKQQAITGFLTYAVEELRPLGLPVTADVFGTIIGSETDVKRVGQDYVEIGATIDAVCPMVYPSHYGNGVFGLAVPDAQPYETVLAAMQDSAEELSVIPEESRAVVRPWLQAFTANWVKGYIPYGGEQIRQQIQAVYDAGYEEWILWNASNRYSADGLLGKRDVGGYYESQSNTF